MVHSNTNKARVVWKRLGNLLRRGGGGHQGVSLVPQGGCSGGPSVQFGVLGAVINDDVGDGGIPCGFLKADHWVAVKVTGRRELGDTGSRGVPKGRREEVGGGVHCSMAGDSGSLGGHTPNLGGLRKTG